MNSRPPLLPLCLVAVLSSTAGCSMAPYQHAAGPAAEAASTPAAAETESPPPAPPSTNAGTPPSVMDSLYQQYREWKGTRYALGGISKKGIDCSALVYLTYRDHLGIKLPRTTEYQALAGNAVTRGQLQAGDLVFFKTGRTTRHVGIYLEDGKFLHASTSKGVTISNIADYYWKRRYWRARRLDLGAAES